MESATDVRGRGARTLESQRRWESLGPATSVLNAGAGCGSYEPPNRLVVGVEPSGDDESDQGDDDAEPPSTSGLSRWSVHPSTAVRGNALESAAVAVNLAVTTAKCG